MSSKPPITTGTIIRTLVLAIALINQLLVGAGYSPLPINDGNAELILSTIFTAIAAIIAWWKNNDFTDKALKSRELAKQKGLK